VSLLDTLFGRTKPVKSKLEKLFAMSTAYVTLTVDQGLTASGRAGVTFRPIASSNFSSSARELKDLLALSGKETSTKIRISEDDFGYQWVVLEDAEFEDLVATIHMISLTLQEHGYSDQLLAAVFKFLDNRQPVYWIYNFKRGTFYPFVPSGKGRERDNNKELRLRAVMEKEMPLEPELERWYPVWDSPV
jgi:hypothetical protein